MSQPSEDQDQQVVSIETVVSVLRDKVADLTWQNVLLEARLRESQRAVEDLMIGKETVPPSVS